MTVYQGSRYENTDIYPLLGSDGRLHNTLVVPQSTVTETMDYTVYTTQYGDRIDSLAFAFLQNPELWWEIAALNPGWFYWDDLPPNLQIAVPIVNQ